MKFTIKIAEAIIKARQIHEDVNQKYGDKPYFESHVMMVLEVALRYIHLIPEDWQEDVILAVLFHDTIEDCRLTYNDVVKLIGMRAADMVFGVTSDQGKTRDERNSPALYKRMRDNFFAIFIKLSDRIANMNNSLKKGHDMLNKYNKEYPKFKKELYQRGAFLDLHNVDLQPMWNELDNILNKRPDVEFRID